MSSFKGIYGLTEILTTIVIGLWLAFYNAIYLVGAIELGFDKMNFPFVFINLCGAFLLFLPLISIKLKSKETFILAFLSPPAEGESITYPVLSSFLSEQALGAFLGTTIIFTTVNAIEEIGSTLAGIYCFILFFLAVFIVTFSGVRFSFYFKTWSDKWRFVGALVTAVIMMSFFEIGVALGKQ